MYGSSYLTETMCPIRDDMTVSRDAKLESSNVVTWFSLGKDTTISRERYDKDTVYYIDAGQGTFIIGEEAHKEELKAGQLLIVPGKTLCGVETQQGLIYTEIISEKEIIMNKLVKSGEALELKNLISYEEGSITNIDIVKNDTMKYVLMAFDKGTGLTPHRAPGNAIVTALEGEAIIGYEGTDYKVHAGESFRFEKEGLHSVTATEKFKMSLLLVLE